jgi:riboflavin kinase/FMN adenylyltransferase
MTTQLVFESLDEVRLPEAKPLVLTVGTFDGVHLAHQALMREAVERARAMDGIAAVLTFQNHPREVVTPQKFPPLLTSWPRKKELILAQGVDLLTGLLFDEKFSETPAEDFVEHVVVEKLRARVVICGPAFHFGHKARGNADLLGRLGKKFGFEFHCREPIMHDGVKVSSTRIRQAVAEGDVAFAAGLLTRPHMNEGRVVIGDRLGRRIGFPTANLEIDPRYLLPANGVYAVRASLENGDSFPAMMNIGWRPTVGGVDHRKEVHLIGFDGELEDQQLRVEYHQRLRDEKKFDGLEGLTAQLARDRQAALEVFAG